MSPITMQNIAPALLRAELATEAEIGAIAGSSTIARTPAPSPASRASLPW